MKKLFVLALSALMVMSVSAQEAKKEFKGERKAKFEQREFKGDRVEFKGDREMFKGGRPERHPEFRPEFGPQGPEGKCPREISKEEMLEFRIKGLADELYLDSVQTEAFAKTYREFAKDRAEIWEKAMKEMKKVDEKYAKEFGKTLNDKQVKRVLRPEGPCCGKHCHKHGKK